MAYDKMPDLVPEIYSQRFIGGENFARRVVGRLNSLNARPEDREGRAPPGNYGKKADDIIRQVGEIFQIPSNTVRLSRYSKGIVALARMAAVLIIRDNIPWTFGEIAEYFHLHNSSSAYQLYSKAKKNKALLARISTVKN